MNTGDGPISAGVSASRSDGEVEPGALRDDVAARRRFLVGGVAAAAALAAGPLLVGCSEHDGASEGEGPDTGPREITVPEPTHVVDLEGDPFTLGVASGDPDQDSVVIWTRLALDPVAEDGLGGVPAEPIDVVWEVADGPDFSKLLAAGIVTAEPDHAHAIHVLVEDLEPGRRVHYRFRCGGRTSPVGTTSALPSGSPEDFRLAVANCQMYEAGHWAAYRHLVEDEPDLVVHLGDYVYEYPFEMVEGRRPLPGRVLATLADYRVRYGCYKREPELRDAHAAAPFVVTWDDHDVANNYAGDLLATSRDPEAARALKTIAYRVWWEHTATRLPKPTGPRLDVHRSIEAGDLFRLHLLDERQHADEPPCRTGDPIQAMLDMGACEERFEDRQHLGEEQERWLFDGLARGGVRWNILANPVVLAGVNVGVDADSFYLDTWDGYPKARERLVAALAEAENPVILTGDYHAGMTLEVRERPFEDSPVVAPEFMSPPISSTLFSASAKARTPHLLEQIDAHGYLRVDVGADELTVAFRCLDDVTDRDARVETRATWTVSAGDPRPRRT